MGACSSQSNAIQVNDPIPDREHMSFDDFSDIFYLVYNEKILANSFEELDNSTGPTEPFNQYDIESRREWKIYDEKKNNIYKLARVICSVQKSMSIFNGGKRMYSGSSIKYDTVLDEDEKYVELVFNCHLSPFHFKCSRLEVSKSIIARIWIEDDVPPSCVLSTDVAAD